MASFTTCKKCLSVETEREQVASADVDDGSVDWIETRCENCGHAETRVSGRVHTGRTARGFEMLEDTEVVARRERVEELTGEKPWN